MVRGIRLGSGEVASFFRLLDQLRLRRNAWHVLLLGLVARGRRVLL